MNDTLELIDLEQLLEDECKCESRTHDKGRVTCSLDVAFRLGSCLPPVNVCTSMGLRAQERIHRKKSACNICGANLEDCWTIHPI